MTDLPGGVGDDAPAPSTGAEASTGETHVTGSQATSRAEPTEPVTTIELVGDVYVVSLRGEVDAYSAPSLRLDLRRLIEEDGASTIVVDLAAVTFMDSSALGALVGTLRRLRERDGRLRIVQPQAAASRIFELTGLGGVLDLYPGRDAALSAASE